MSWREGSSSSSSEEYVPKRVLESLPTIADELEDEDEESSVNTTVSDELLLAELTPGGLKMLEKDCPLENDEPFEKSGMPKEEEPPMTTVILEEELLRLDPVLVELESELEEETDDSLETDDSKSSDASWLDADSSEPS